MAAERAFRPRWAGGWAAARVAFGVAALDAQLARISDVRHALAVPELVFASGPTRITDTVMWGAGPAWALWALGLVPVVGVLVGGRWAKPGVLGWFGLHAALLGTLGLNVRAPERLIFWIVVGLLLAPIGERALDRKWRGPAPRWYLMVVFSALYGSTGVLKLIAEPAWWSGTALRYDLLDRFHAGGALATWLSAQPELCLVMSRFTVLFEASFPLLIWWPAATPWVLLAGACMHLGIGTLMSVGPLGTMAVAMYPALCDPDRAQAIWARVRPRGSELLRRLLRTRCP